MTVVEDKQEVARRQDEERYLANLAARQENNSDDALVTDGFVVPDLEVSGEAPPAYGEQFDQMQFSQPGFEAGAAVTDDGRVNININTKNKRLSQLLAPAISRQAANAAAEVQEPLPPAYIPPSLGGLPDQTPPPRLNVVVQIVGSRGDVQPFVALGKTLKETYGHRVRIATHSTFQAFVEDNGLEFFNIGGDPAELMAFMVKHPGLMPGFDAVKSGEITKRRKGIEQILMGCWRSCIEAGDGLGPPPKPHAKNEPLDLAQEVPADPSKPPFVADVIIANPPSFAHIHVAEKLGIPLHMMFTMPWTPTRAFQHPLANIQSTNADAVLTNHLSYILVEMMTWQGLGDVINRFREKALDLSPLSLLWAPGLLTRLKISYTYCWSPALIPKPNDWGRNIDISGFFFLDLATSYTPDPELDAFLKAGPPPVYIGFGSIVVDDPNAMTRMIFDAIHLAGCRALVSKGWGGLGADDVGLPEGVFMLGNVPHDWLFQHVSCVVHHGGAGTTAAGIKAGKPTFVVPFFGDQPFWGSMISRAKAGPDPVPYKQLTADKLAEAIKFCLQSDTVEQAGILGAKIREEKGTDVGGQSFHKQLDIESMRCSVAPSRPAAWRVRRTKVRLSPLVATVLVNEGHLKYSDLKLYRAAEYDTYDQPTDPISAGAASIMVDLGTIGMAIADMPRDIWKSHKKRKGEQPVKITGDSESASKPTDASSQPSQDTTEASQVLSTDVNASQRSLSQVSSQTTPADDQSQVTDTQSAAAAASSSSQAEAGSSQQKPSPSGSFGMDAAVDTARGVNRVVATGMKSPMNFCLGLARGFRNVPKLYNDDTVRSVDKVTNFQSGLKVAGKELGYGFFDGISGLVTQPLRGAEKGGAAGLVKGFGKGIGGLITKPAAGIYGLPAYTMQGIHAELNQLFSKSVHNYIISSRVRQGELDEKNATPEERQDILKRWDNIKFDLANFYQFKRKGKSAEKIPPGGSPGADDEGSPDKGFSKPRTSWLQTRHLSPEQRKKMQEEKKSWKRGYVEAQIPGQSASGSSTPGSLAVGEDAELEQAIQASVRETSRGNPEEDAMIEAAIRESVNTMRDRGDLPETGAGDASDEKKRMDPTIFEDEQFQITDEEYQKLVENAIQQSLSGYGVGSQQHETGAAGTDDKSRKQQGDVSYHAGAQRPQQQPPPLPDRNVTSQHAEEDDEELQRAIAASRDDMQRTSAQRSEEDIVMDYVMKQSKAEEEYRQQASKGQGTNVSGQEDDDEELKKAMDESLKLSGDGGGDGASGSKS